MKNKDKELVANCIENEGFDYAFRYYSSFEEIKDNEFHKKREAYIKAAEDLEQYTFGKSFAEYQEERDFGEDS